MLETKGFSLKQTFPSSLLVYVHNVQHQTLEVAVQLALEPKPNRQIGIRQSHIHKWLWVKNRVTPKWLALVNGNMDDSTCGTIAGGLILTHAQMDKYPKDRCPACAAGRRLQVLLRANADPTVRSAFMEAGLGLRHSGFAILLKDRIRRNHWLV